MLCITCSPISGNLDFNNRIKSSIPRSSATTFACSEVPLAMFVKLQAASNYTLNELYSRSIR